MMWDKPLELFEDEYKITFKCLKLEKFDVQHDNGCVTTYRKTTGELVFIHFFPEADDITYNKENKTHTYYQASDLLSDEQKTPEEIPNELVLKNPHEVQVFLNAVMKLQKEAENQLNEEGN